MTNDNVIEFPKRYRSPEEGYPKNHIPTPEAFAYFTNEFIDERHTTYAGKAYLDRLEAEDTSWLDYVTVLLGVPSYIQTQVDLEAINIPVLEVPLGMLVDLAFVSNVSFNVAVQWEDEDDVMHLLHVSFQEFEFMARVKANALNELFDEAEIHDRKQFIITLFLERAKQDHKDISLNTLMAVSSTMPLEYEGTELKDLDLIQLYHYGKETIDMDDFTCFADFYNSVISLIDSHPVDLRHDKRIIFANDVVGRTATKDLVNYIEAEEEATEAEV